MSAFGSPTPPVPATVQKQATRFLGFLLLSCGPRSSSGRLRHWWLRYASRLVRRSGLFDEDYYDQRNPDVAADGMDLLRHYLLYGDREGRQPMPWFDPEHYRRSGPVKIARKHNALLHYLLIGRFSNPEVGPQFHAGHFLSVNRDARLNRHEPLAWSLRRGAPPSETHTPYALHHAPLASSAPSDAEWDTLPARRGGEPLVDVIVPVYGGREETLRCLHGVLNAPQETTFHLVVVNDASPDKELAMTLRDLAARNLIELVENRRNLGFVSSVNRALLLHPDRDAVLLNADTEPHNDWIDRLRATAYRHPRVATVTPLSNNATIASYPRFDRDNPGPLELTSREFDQLTAQTNRGTCVSAPTGVGFCLYVRRAALDEVGLFDEVAFGRGYGEENDFCRRAAAAGWDHRIAADVYVWHWGTRSFKGLKGKRVRHAMQVMDQRHPDYRLKVAEFAADDPLAPLRTGLDRARLLRQRTPDGNVLVLMHTRGGGAAKHLEEEFQRLTERHLGGFLLQPESEDYGRLSAIGLPRLPNLPPIDLTCPAQLEALLEWLGISEIHIHQLVDFPRAITGQGRGTARGIATAARRRGIPFDFYIHDYQYICPRINLVSSGSIYCGEPDENACRHCLSRRIHGIENPRVTDIRAWRIRHGTLLARARRVVVPDRDVLQRLSTYYPHAHYLVRPHEDAAEFPPTLPRRAGCSGPLRIVVPGAISVVKGYDVILAVAQAAKRRRLPLEIVVMGYTRRDKDLAKAGVKITGRYADDEAASILQDIDADVAWIPSVWPEAYCYALSIPLRAGLAVAAFDLGAQASRLRHHGGPHLLLPLSLTRHPRKLATALQKFAAAQRSSAQQEAA